MFLYFFFFLRLKLFNLSMHMHICCHASQRTEEDLLRDLVGITPSPKRKVSKGKWYHRHILLCNTIFLYLETQGQVRAGTGPLIDKSSLCVRLKTLKKHYQEAAQYLLNFCFLFVQLCFLSHSWTCLVAHNPRNLNKQTDNITTVIIAI